VVKHLPGKLEALSSKGTAKGKKKEEAAKAVKPPVLTCVGGREKAGDVIFDKCEVLYESERRWLLIIKTGAHVQGCGWIVRI
jgi:hypothetical protein